MIKPTVGRMVWVWCNGYPGRPGEQPLSGQIAHVNDDGTLNLCVLSEYGVPAGMSNVPLNHADMECLGPSATWMPYQKGQAARTEAAETAAAK